MKISIAVTHLLGAGHLTRAATLARVFMQAGHDVQLISGGQPAPHIKTDDLNLIQLPAVRSDGVDFSRLLDVDGATVDAPWLEARAALAEAAIRGFGPDVFITELFPFGRRQLRDEFLRMIEAAGAAKICASVRDILAPPSKPKKEAYAREVVEAHYDVVMVHSDPAVVPLETSWPVADDWRDKLRYTGFLTPGPLPAAASNPRDVIVSAGGGSVGRGVFLAAVEAAHLLPELSFHILVGGVDAAEVVMRLREGAPANVLIEPARKDFRGLLAAAKVSVSMCGYNTSMDLLQSGVPSVIVPFDDGDEKEQSLRAQALAQLEGVSVLTSDALSAEALAERVKVLLDAPRRDSRQFDLDGERGALRVLDALGAG